MSVTNVDIAIIGAGMVGLTLAKALEKSPLRIAIIENKTPKSPLSEAPSLRVCALNHASENILKNLGVWEGIISKRHNLIEKMSVWEQDSFAKIEFDPTNIDLASFGLTRLDLTNLDRADFNLEEKTPPHLGSIVENKVIQFALLESVKKQSNVTFFCPDTCTKLMFGETEAWLTLDSGQSISTKLVVGADGAHSWVRNQVSIPLTQWDYGHTALIANVRTALAHDNIARQIFSPEGPLAFLPLSDPHLSSIVWSQPPELAEKRQALDADEFNKALTCAFDSTLGLCALEGERAIFPLKMRYARDFVVERTALIGDAAHTFHPLAGQGVNLGLLDAVTLAQELMRLHHLGKDIGTKANLRIFERWRKAQTAQMIASMQGFRDLFSGKNPAKKLIRGIGLMAAAKLPGIKNTLMKRALGLTGDLPTLAKRKVTQ